MSIENKTEQKESKKILCPKAGTATSSLANNTAAQSNMNIINVILVCQANGKTYFKKPA